jgi:hypothetical protein
MSIFKTTQLNNINFRAQLIRFANKSILWIAESEEEIYAINFDKALSADIYQLEKNTKVILLYVDDDEIHSIDIGNFTQEDGMRFLTWLQTSLT